MNQHEPSLALLVPILIRLRRTALESSPWEAIGHYLTAAKVFFEQ
ncbi:MAG: hypothetical protein WAN33_00905 [Candidatus Acidiferrales bacterium]